MYISAVYIRWCLISMNTHYFRGDANRQPERPTFFHVEYDRFSVIFEEKDYTDILSIFQARCKEFDSEYYYSAIAPAKKYSLSLLKGMIEATDRFLGRLYLGEQKDDMRHKFIHHIMRYMRFELKILDQKLMQAQDDWEMSSMLELRRTFYRKHMGVMQNELATRARN